MTFASVFEPIVTARSDGETVARNSASPEEESPIPGSAGTPK